MKKTAPLTLALAGCLLALSCVHTIPDKGLDIDLSGKTLFVADLESVEMMESAPAWEEGDQIGVFGSESGENACFVLEKSGVGSNAATFYGPMVKGDVIAYHPYDKGMGIDNGQVAFWLAPQQSFMSGGEARDQFREYCHTSFASEEEDGTLHFQYPLGILSVQICFEPGINVKRMKVSSKTGISGKLLYGYGNIVIPSPDAYDYVILDFGESAVPSLSGNSFTNFCFVLPPKIYEEGCMTLEIVSEEDVPVVTLPKIEIKRVWANHFEVTAVKIGMDGLGHFTGTEGFLE